MTLPTAGIPQELLSVFVNVVPSMAGSQAILMDAAREGGRLYASEFERSAGDAMRPAMARIGASMASGLSAGLGASAGQVLLQHLMPGLSSVVTHWGRLGRSSGDEYVKEFEARYKNMMPIFEDMSAKAVLASKALIQTTAQMGGQMHSSFGSFSKETQQASEEMMAAWASKMKVGVGIAAAAAAYEFVHNTKRVFAQFAHVGEDAAHDLVGGFQAVMHGKMPDLLASFNVLEEGAKTALDAPFEAVKSFLPTLGLVEKGFDALTFGALDRFKDALSPVMGEILQVGDEYLGLTRKLASATVNPEDLERLSGSVREIMASGAVVHFDDVADSIGRLNANIKGLDTGQLKELTTSFAEAEELVNHIDETKFAGIVNAWKVPAEQANETLTMLVNTARATGVDINMLTDEMTRSGPSFRDLGYNAQQTAAFFGEMTAQGEKGTRLIFAMAEADKKLNEVVAQGKFKSTKEAWDALIGSVKAYEDAGQHAAAMGLLEQYVTPSTAAMLVEMIGQGKVSASQLGDAIEGVGANLGEAVEKTKDLGQTFEVVGQQISAALSPMGMALAVGLRDAGTHVSRWLEENQGKVAHWALEIAIIFSKVMGGSAKFFAHTLAFLGPMLDAMKEAFSTTARIVLDMIRPTLDALGDIPGMGKLHKVAADLNGVRQMLDQTEPFSFDKIFGSSSDAIDRFVDTDLPKLLASGQDQVDDLRVDEDHRKRGYKIWFDDDDPTKVKVKAKTKDGQDINDASDLVPPGETSLTFTPGFDQPRWHGQAPPQGFAFGGPTVPAVNGLPTTGDHIPAYLEVGEYVVNRAAAQRHRRELDAINYGRVGYETGGVAGLEVLYGFLRGVAQGVGLDLPKDKDKSQSAYGAAPWPGYSTSSRTGAPSGPVGQDWLRSQLLAHGLSPDQAKGILAMNVVEGGASDPKSLLGFTESQAQGPQAHVGAFMQQWNDPSRRGPGGSIPGVDSSGRVTDWGQYMTWIRTRIVGQTGVKSDWQGNAQPAPGDYQNRLMSALRFQHGGHVGDGGSWFGSTVHEHPGPDTASLAKHFAHFRGGGCAECGGKHPTGFCGGGIAHFAKGGDAGEAFSQVIWSNKETGQDIGENAGKWVGTPGSADPGFYHRGHNDFADHTGHVHTTVLRDPFSGAPYNQIKAGSKITAGSPGFPSWVYKLGNMYHVKPSTYAGHQEWDGVNHGIDWWPADATPNMTGQGYGHQDFVTLTGFATATGSMSAGQSQGAPAGAGFAGGTPGWQGYGMPMGAGADLPGGPYSTDGGVGGDGGYGGSQFNGGSFPPGSPIGPQGRIGPGYNPWTNPPPGLERSPQKMQKYTHDYEEWQLQDEQRRRRHDEAQEALTDAIKEQADAYTAWKALDDKWRSETADQQKLDTDTQKKLKEATDKLSESNSKLQHARDTATQDQLDDQVGHPPPQPGKEGEKSGGPFESMSEQLGQGLVKGIAQSLGFPDVFGKGPMQWGLSRLLMGGLGFGLNVGNAWADRAMDGGGGPLAGLVPGGAGFPGSLPDQSGGPLGAPPGPPDGSVPPPGPSATPPSGTPPSAPTLPAVPSHAVAPRTQLHRDAQSGEWLDAGGNMVAPWRFQAPLSAGGLGGNFDVVGGTAPPPAPRRPLPAPMGPAPHGADHWDPNKGWVDSKGNLVGTPGGGQSAPFSYPGAGTDMFDGTDNYEASANAPSPFGFAPGSAAAGGVGGSYAQQFVNQGPALMVWLQDKGFRDRLLGRFGGHPNAPMKAAVPPPHMPPPPHPVAPHLSVPPIKSFADGGIVSFDDGGLLPPGGLDVAHLGRLLLGTSHDENKLSSGDVNGQTAGVGRVMGTAVGYGLAAVLGGKPDSSGMARLPSGPNGTWRDVPARQLPPLPPPGQNGSWKNLPEPGAYAEFASQSSSKGFTGIRQLGDLGDKVLGPLGDITMSAQAGAAFANSIQGTSHPWWWALKQGVEAPGKIADGIITGQSMRGQESNRTPGVVYGPGGSVLSAGPQRPAPAPHIQVPHHYAAGAVLPSAATIAPPQQGLVQWAEPSTGGEAFIPLKGGQRSLNIWAKTGKMLGAFADGGFIDKPPPTGHSFQGNQLFAQQSAAYAQSTSEALNGPQWYDKMGGAFVGGLPFGLDKTINSMGGRFLPNNALGKTADQYAPKTSGLAAVMQPTTAGKGNTSPHTNNVAFNNYNTGVTDVKTMSKAAGSHYDQAKRWAPANQMFRTGVSMS